MLSIVEGSSASCLTKEYSPMENESTTDYADILPFSGFEKLQLAFVNPEDLCTEGSIVTPDELSVVVSDHDLRITRREATYIEEEVTSPCPADKIVHLKELYII